MRDSTQTPKSYKAQSILDEDTIEAMNTLADYRAANKFLTQHAPAAVNKHVDLVRKNRKDNQQRK
jgi:hypothetical protein